jgi:formylglycine-generating enzyme required for sulfatase activity
VQQLETDVGRLEMPISPLSLDLYQRVTAYRQRLPLEFQTETGLRMRWIPPGRFVQGSPAVTGGRRNETPHEVLISQGFYLGVCTVTQVEWQAVCGSQPWQGRQDCRQGDRYPAVWVTWKQAVEFCEQLSVREGRQFRLPTESEWEWACRSGGTGAFSFGDDEGQLGQYGWYDGNADAEGEPYAHEVALMRANALGLYDLHGNVCEWCQDVYCDDPGNRTEVPDENQRVVRGGSWHHFARNCRSAWRDRCDQNQSDRNIGFRVLCELP